MGAAGAGFSSLMSETTASVVRTTAAIEAAFWSAERVTLVGSTDADLDHVNILLGGSIKAVADLLALENGIDDN